VKNALDIGCGTGDFIKLLRQGGLSVTGLDISPKVIESTRKRFIDDENVELLSGPVVDVPLKDNFYDLVTSVTVLQHILGEDELIESLELIRRSMKFNGKMIVLELAPPHKEPIMYYNEGIPYLLERPPHIWKSLFDRAGFELIEEPVMPQLGISMLRSFGFLIEKLGKLRVTKSALSSAKVDTNPADSHASKQTFLQQVKHHGFVSIRKLILLVARPFDHTLHLPIPYVSKRHYHIFIYKLKNQ
jgi:SAM-dependent methyltransferase